MTEIFFPQIEFQNPQEAIGAAELEEALRRARAPIIKAGFAEPWSGDQSRFDPAQAGWEQAAGNVLAKIQQMQSSGLVQLTPEGLTPRQAAAKSGEAAKLTEADARAAELAERLRLAAGVVILRPLEETSESLPRDQWNQLPDDQGNADLGEWYRKLQAGEPIEDWQRQALKDYNIWRSDSPPPAEEAEELAAGPEEEKVEEQAKRGLAKWLKKIDFGKLAREGARYLIPPLTGLALGRLLPPEQALNLTQTAFAVGMLGFIGSGGCAVAERVVSGHPRVAGIARLLAAGKVIGAVFAETGMLMSAGSFAGGLWHEREIVRQAAAQMGQPEVGGIGRVGGLPPDERSVSPSAPVAGGGEYNPPFPGPNVPGAGNLGGPVAFGGKGGGINVVMEEARRAALEAATRVHAVSPNETLSAIVSRYGGRPMGIDMTNTILQSAGELRGGTDLAGNVRPGAEEAVKLVEYLQANPTVTWQQAVNEGLKTATGDLVAKLFGNATRMIYPGKLLNVVVGAGVP